MKQREKMGKRLAALGVSAALLLAAGCSGLEPPAPAQAEGPKAIEVQTVSASYGTIDRQTEFVGRVEAAESVKVYATSQAKVLETYAVPGQHVEKGQLLFQLDTENLETMVETSRLQYEAAVSGANTTIIQSKNAYDSAGDMYTTIKESRDAIEDAWEGAQRSLNQANAALQAAQEAGVTGEELAKLQTAQVAAQMAYEQARNAYIQNYDKLDEQVKSARKSLITARDTYKNTKGDEDEGITGTIQTQVDLAKISYDNAVKALNEAKVYAPVSGVISMKNVAASDMATPGAPAYVIDQDSAAPMISFNLSEDGANALTVGSPVTVSYNGQDYPAQITELSNAANPQTGLYAAKAQTEEPLGTSRSGGVVKVKASTAKAENALLLPLELLEYDENQPYVYLFRDGVAVRADVVTGISSAEEVVILSGITAGDQIITTWHPDLRDGAAVALAAEK
ncbi:MAG: efflux RND transporter periplasmic adaptor subunit [Angelakisella sp.]|nr:efflux RND transporter periplasmic adaptor subunit [Angelakisella sp.]